MSCVIARHCLFIQQLIHLFNFHLGFVQPMQDVALHQCIPLSYVCCFHFPGGSLLPCYVVLPFSAWSTRVTHLEISKFSVLLAFALVSKDLNIVEVIFSLSLYFFLKNHLNVV